MNIQKVCEYLSDMGVLLFDNIDLFFQIHSTKKNKQFKNEPDNLKDSLFLYLQKTSKNENLLRQMSKQLIESYYNSKAILRYKNIKNLVNIFQNKLFLIYNNVILNLSKHIANNKDKIKRTNSDDYIFRRSNENSPKKVVKKAKSKPKKKLQRPKKTNQYKNNYYKNIQETNVNNPHSFFLNNNDFYLNMYNNDINVNNPYQYNERINTSTDDFNNNIYNNENIVSYKYYSPMVNIQSKKPINHFMQNVDGNINEQTQILMNNNMPNYNIINNNENNLQMTPQQQFNQFERKEFINDNIDFEAPDDYDFFDNEQKHLQKVQNKIMNLKNEKITKLEEQCTFTPQINTNYKNPPKNNNNNINTFEKLYNDSSLNRLKKEEKIKKYLDELTFQPKIEHNDKYKVTTSFADRNHFSVNKKENKKNEEKKTKETSKKKKPIDEKEIVNRLYKPAIDKINKEKKEKLEEEKKRKKIIDWKKVFKDYNKKYPEGDDYKRQLERRKKILENLSNNKDKEDKNNNIMDFNDFLKEKEKEQNNINEKNNTNNASNGQENNVKENNNINNNIIQSGIVGEEKKDNNEIIDDNNIKPKEVQEVHEAINEAYRSASIKNLLNNNNLFQNNP